MFGPGTRRFVPGDATGGVEKLGERRVEVEDRVPARIIVRAGFRPPFTPAVAHRLLLKKCDEARGRY